MSALVPAAYPSGTTNVRRAASMSLSWLLLVAISCDCNHAICFESPTLVDRLELRDAGNMVVWRLIGDGQRKLTNVEYGVVPAGYRQTWPERGQPRPLRPGESLLLLWRGEGQFVRHWGRAAERGAIHYGVSMNAPVAGKADSELFVDAPRTIDPAKGYPR